MKIRQESFKVLIKDDLITLENDTDQFLCVYLRPAKHKRKISLINVISPRGFLSYETLKNHEIDVKNLLFSLEDKQ